jgi:hypothetical protein
VATDPTPDLTFQPLSGKPRSLRELLTTFHLAFVALDPFTDESAWVLPTAVRILTNFEQSDARVAFVVTATPDECRMFLGPHAREILTFADPDRSVVKGFGLERLPAFVHVAMDGTVAASAEGWRGSEWRAVADELALVTSWSPPVIPSAGDPAPFAGTPAAG